jgi:hypothetical protein
MHYIYKIIVVILVLAMVVVGVRAISLANFHKNLMQEFECLEFVNEGSDNLSGYLADVWESQLQSDGKEIRIGENWIRFYSVKDALAYGLSYFNVNYGCLIDNDSSYIKEAEYYLSDVGGSLFGNKELKRIAKEYLCCSMTYFESAKHPEGSLGDYRTNMKDKRNYLDSLEKEMLLYFSSY